MKNEELGKNFSILHSQFPIPSSPSPLLAPRPVQQPEEEGATGQRRDDAERYLHRRGDGARDEVGEDQEERAAEGAGGEEGAVIRPGDQA